MLRDFIEMSYIVYAFAKHLSTPANLDLDSFLGWCRVVDTFHFESCSFDRDWLGPIQAFQVFLGFQLDVTGFLSNYFLFDVAF